MAPDSCFSSAITSPLAQLFARRASMLDNPRTAISGLVATLFKDRCRTPSITRLENFLTDRNISEVVYKKDLDCDGSIQPLGLSFADGFRITINRSLPTTRLRFTLAHELCHTFFYEHVPEMKFVPHEIDHAEERLCNIGAAELLMPTKSVLRITKEQPVCLRSLEGFANTFGVSTEAMLVRLRSLRLWNADLSYWTRHSSGGFVSEQVGSVTKAQWTWRGNELLKTWETGRSVSGKTFIEYSDASGGPRVKPICYEMQRRGTRIFVLQGAWTMLTDDERSPLFAKSGKMHGDRQALTTPAHTLPLAIC
jgi:Zn-dependent peptidase ImmA (M78 family)